MITKDPWVRALVIVTLMIASIYLVGLAWQVASGFADIILLFFLAWMLAFIIEPTAAPLQERARLPRTLSIALAYLGLLVIIVLGIVVVIPPLTAQIVQIVTDLPTYAEQLTRDFLALQVSLEARGVHINLEAALAPDDLARRAETAAPLLVSNVLGFATSVASLAFQSVLVVILSFYFALDGRRFSQLFVSALPRQFHDDGLYFVESINRAFSGFLRGQLILAITYAVGTAAILTATGLPYVLLASVAAGVLMLIPFIGPFVALIVPMSIVLLAQSSSAWIVLVASVILQQVVFNVIAPRVMSQSVGLHPLLVFFVVLAGARVAGVWGALFGVPIVAVLSAMVTFYRINFAAHRLREQVDAAVSPPEDQTVVSAPDPVEVSAR